jgi:tellurite resistance protein TehA-like permease
MQAAIMWVTGVSVFFLVMLFCYIMYRKSMTRHADNRARIFMAISIICYVATAAVDIATIYILFGEGEEIIDSIKWIVIGSLSHIFKLWALFIALITSGRYVRENDEVKPILGADAQQP